MKDYYVYLGRFCPLHLGHQKVLEKILEKHDISEILVIIGSATSYNERTPYTFDERAQMIHSVFPLIKVMPLPDTEPNLIYFRGDTNDIWLNNIKEIENKMGAIFTFFGGSGEDLDVLSHKFKTEVIVEREKTAEKISATKVRDAFKNGDFEEVKKMIDPKVYTLAIDGYKKFTSSINR